MNLKVNLIFLGCLIWGSGWMLNDEDRHSEYSSSEDWDRMLTDMVRLCPKQQFCGKRGINDDNVSHPENSCCRGCSCDRNCSESHDCCWGDDGSPLTKCLRPITGNIDLLLKKYYFVSEPPTDGCKMGQGRKGHVQINECEAVQGQGQEGNVTCSSDEMAAPWGNFYPVYSRSVDKNFKNAACARCHGAADIECWRSVLHSDLPIDFVGSLADFNEKNIFVNSYVVFNPPNEESSSFDKLCFTEIDTCTSLDLDIDRFYIPSNVKMDRESTMKACNQGPRAVYLDRPGWVFKNVFCAICSHFTNKFTDGMRCETTLDDSRTENPPIHILLDAGYFDSIRRTKSPKKVVKTECYRPKHSVDESICKELHCPSLQTRLQTGKCGYPAKIASFKHLAMCLNVSTKNSLDQDRYDVMNMGDSQIVSLFEESSPWPKTYWTIFVVGARLFEREGSEFLVCLTWNKQTINLETLIKQINTNLYKNWHINLQSKVKFDQTIFKHGKISSPYYDNMMKAVWKNYAIFPKNEDLTPPIWKRQYLTDQKVLGDAFYVDQMFLCEQIELSPHEYKLDMPGAVLYLTTTKSYLYPGQYTHLITEDGSWRVRVCLKDSGYVKVVSGTGTMPGKEDYFVISFTVLLSTRVFRSY